MKYQSVLEWTYSPKDFFEEEKEFRDGDIIIKLLDGKASLHTYSVDKGASKEIRQELIERIDAIFLGGQLVNEKPYTLEGPAFNQFDDNGNQIHVLFAESVEFLILSDGIDIVHKDRYGNVIHDSKRERIDERDQCIQLARNSFFRDSTAKHLLKVFHEAKSDKVREFFLLYEIVDALGHAFQSKEKAKSALGISKTKWSRFTKLLNELPVEQSRHRGNFVEDKRKLKQEEEEEIFKLAASFITKYLVYLSVLN